MFSITSTEGCAPLFSRLSASVPNYYCLVRTQTELAGIYSSSPTTTTAVAKFAVYVGQTCSEAPDWNVCCSIQGVVSSRTWKGLFLDGEIFSGFGSRWPPPRSGTLCPNPITRTRGLLGWCACRLVVVLGKALFCCSVAPPRKFVIHSVFMAALYVRIDSGTHKRPPRYEFRVCTSNYIYVRPLWGREYITSIFVNTLLYISYVCVCFHIKPFFVPVDVQLYQQATSSGRADSSILEGYKFCGHKNYATAEILLTLLRYCTTRVPDCCIAVMQCDAIVLDTSGTT